MHSSIVDLRQVLLLHLSFFKDIYVSFDDPRRMAEWMAFLRLLIPRRNGLVDRRLLVDILDLDEIQQPASPRSIRSSDSRSMSHIPSQVSLVSGTEYSTAGPSKSSKLKPGWAMKDRLAAEM